MAATDEPIDSGPSFYRTEELSEFSPTDGIGMRGIVGGNLMANWVRLDPNATMPKHSHPHEQLSVVLEGAMELTLGDQTLVVQAGMAYTIPGGVSHSGVALKEGCLVLDIFTPPREDYLHFVAGQR